MSLVRNSLCPALSVLSIFDNTTCTGEHQRFVCSNATLLIKLNLRFQLYHHLAEEKAYGVHAGRTSFHGTFVPVSFN